MKIEFILNFHCIIWKFLLGSGCQDEENLVRENYKMKKRVISIYKFCPGTYVVLPALNFLE